MSQRKTTKFDVKGLNPQYWSFFLLHLIPFLYSLLPPVSQVVMLPLFSASAADVDGPAAHAGAGGGQLACSHRTRPLRHRRRHGPLHRLLRQLDSIGDPLQYCGPRGVCGGRVLSGELSAQRGTAPGEIGQRNSNLEREFSGMGSLLEVALLRFPPINL